MLITPNARKRDPRCLHFDGAGNRHGTAQIRIPLKFAQNAKSGIKWDWRRASLFGTPAH
jgi:hypothetical protein